MGRRQRAIRDVIRAVDPDVLCVQEVWADERDDGSSSLAASLDRHVVRTDPVFFRGESFGNAILSRWPLTRTADEALPNEDGQPGHRRIVTAAVSTPWGDWPVGSTHLEHRFDHSATRRDQLRSIMVLCRDLRGDPATDLPMVIGADLNAVPDSDEVRMVTGRAPGVRGIVFSDAWEQAGDGPGHTWLRRNPASASSAWPDRRLDYLLVSWPRPKPVGNPRRAWLAGGEPLLVDGSTIWPSDHCAVVTELTTPDDPVAPVSRTSG